MNGNNQKKGNMDNKKNPLSDVRRYAEWLKDNIFEISSMCGWGGIIRVSEIEIYIGDDSSVARLTILHNDNCATEILCEVNKTTIPLAAALKAVFAVESSIKTGGLRCDAKTKHRWVVAAPFIDEVLIHAMQDDRMPIHFLQANPDKKECKYWKSKITAIWEK